MKKTVTITRKTCRRTDSSSLSLLRWQIPNLHSPLAWARLATQSTLAIASVPHSHHTRPSYLVSPPIRPSLSHHRAHRADSNFDTRLPSAIFSTIVPAPGPRIANLTWPDPISNDYGPTSTSSHIVTRASEQHSLALLPPITYPFLP